MGEKSIQIPNNLSPTLKSIFYRRSVRQYMDKPLKTEEIQTIIHGAMRAPTAGNMMMYTILEVTFKEMKEKLAVTCDNQPFIAKAPLVLIFLADLQRLYDYYCICGVPEECKHRREIFRTPKESDLLLASCDALIAAQNAVITAEALGIGSCYIGDIMENIEKHREMFNLPKWVFPITMLCFGYPKSTVAPEDRQLVPRFPEKYIHFKDSYKHLNATEFGDMYQSFHKMMAGQLQPKGQWPNVGQLMYWRKTGSDFSKEMERSVKKMLKDWLKSD
ncbi:MAG: nitroreductase family protein [Candidatus Lokiarchaeota archaeon]|nr:nitroreductase family protein [Candidatus Harpocratesius repetitus]